MKQIADFVPNWVFPDCNSSLNSPMAWKWYTKLGVVQKRCPIVFHPGHPSNYKVTWDKKIADFDPISAIPDCNYSLNSLMVNDAQSLKQHRRGALLFFKVIHQILRSHGTKNHWLWPELSVSGQILQFDFTNWFEMMHRAWCTIEKVSIVLRGHPSNCKATQAEK